MMKTQIKSTSLAATNECNEKTGIHSEKGMATIETVALLVIFVMLIGYTFGAFGIIHTGILNSIAARTYAFETMRNRSNVTYFRDIPGGDNHHFARIGARIHTIKSESDTTSPNFPATERAMQMGLGGTASLGRDDATIHMQKIPNLVPGRRNTQVEVNPVWIMTQYGICINAKCGGN